MIIAAVWCSDFACCGGRLLVVVVQFDVLGSNGSWG